MQFYLSFEELLGRTADLVMTISFPVLLAATFLEGLLISRWRGAYPWKNAGVSVGMRSDISSRRRPLWVYGMAWASLTDQFSIQTELVPRISWLEWLFNTPRPTACTTRATRITSTGIMRRGADLGSSVRLLSGRAARYSDPLWPGASALGT